MMVFGAAMQVVCSVVVMSLCWLEARPCWSVEYVVKMQVLARRVAVKIIIEVLAASHADR
jgi:hypothetical protein